jgi:excisionase family DNA binding protein
MRAMRDKLITRSEVARRLGIGVRAVRRAAASGELPTYVLGSHVRVRPDDAEHWLERCRRPVSSLTGKGRG